MILEGTKIYLRPLSLEDANGNYPNWLNDPIICKYNSHGDTIYTMQMAIEYINKVTISTVSDVFAICDKATNLHIGNISLQNISKKNRSAEFAILIGEKDYIGKGIGQEAGKLLLRYAFDTLNLHRIYCGTSEDNIPMQKLAIFLDMKEEGISIDAMYRDEKFINVLKYAIVRNT